MPLTVGELFAGVGGIGLGLKWAGMRTIWQVELDARCRAVLAKNFPDAERFADVRDVGSHNLAPVDLIAGGFPCQDLSYAGKGAGITGSRSGLWTEYARIIRELRPRYVLVENVPALLTRGLGVVLGDLAALGYDAEWDCIPALAVGAPHRRDRIFVLAYPNGDGRDALSDGQGGAEGTALDAAVPPGEQRPDSRRSLVGADVLADADRAERGEGTEGWNVTDRDDARRQEACGEGSMADADPERLQERWLHEVGREEVPDAARGRGGDSEPVADAYGDNEHRRAVPVEVGWLGGAGETPPRGRLGNGDQWRVEPDVGRVAHGVPSRVDRLTELGNAVVPQVVEWIGRRIVEAEAGLAEQ